MVKNLIQKAINAAWHATHTPDPVQSVNDLDPWAYAGQTGADPWQWSIFDGGKFAGGFGDTQIQDVDYWTLRARSAQLFNENLYARGLIRRLITNEIGTGLDPECAPDESLLGFEEDGLADWCESTENRFTLWGKTPGVCDWTRSRTFGAIQSTARREALVCGDVLVVLRQDRRTRLPAVQLFNGGAVQTPLGEDIFKLPAGHTVKHGVRIDGNGRQIGFYIKQADGRFKYLPAFGEKSGRRLAWLVYGTDRRLDDVRGQPLLAIVLQSLKEIDRYRDSVQRKAVINSIMAMFIKKTEERFGSLPMTGGAVRRGTADVSDSTTDGTPRKFNIGQYVPGLVVDELQYGEEPVLKGGEGTDTNFGTFEAAVLSAVAWANEVPPEIMTLAFSNNYSASQAAINEFKIYLSRIWGEWGDTFCSPIYVEWLISEALQGRTAAPGLLQAWRDASKYDQLAAWTRADWYGSIKPSTDMLKQVKGSDLLVAGGYSTRAREARITTGTKFSHNVKRLRRENEALAEALGPLLELRQQIAADGTDEGGEDMTDRVDALDARIDAHLEGHDRKQA